MCYMITIHLGCYNKVPEIVKITNYRNLFPTVLEAKESKAKKPAALVSGKGLLSVDTEAATTLVLAY